MNIARKKKLETDIRRLESEREYYVRKVLKHLEKLQKEQRDIEKLENMSLKKAIYTIFSMLVERTEKEKHEALEAKLKYDTAKKDVDNIDRRIASNRQAAAQYAHCGKVFKDLYARKKELLMQHAPETTETIMAKTESLNAAVGRIKEIGEALDAGKKALTSLNEAVQLWSKADDWATWEGRSSLIIKSVKDFYIEEAQTAVWSARRDIEDLNKEIKDVGIPFEIDIEPVYFDSGIFVSRWSKRQTIGEALSSANTTRVVILGTMGNLEELMTQSKTDQRTLRAEIDRLVLDAGNQNKDGRA